MATTEIRVDAKFLKEGRPVDLTVTDDDWKLAEREAKKADPEGEMNVVQIEGKVKFNEFGLFYIRARTGTRKEGAKEKVIPEVRWMPFDDSPIDAYLVYFMFHYNCDQTKANEFLRVRARAQEMIVLRSKVKAGGPRASRKGAFTRHRAA